MFSKVKDILVYALKNIDSQQFKSFKTKLNICELPSPWHGIANSTLQNLDQEDTATHIISYNTINQAPEIVMWILEKINERQLCLEVRTKLKKVGYRSCNVDDKETQTDPVDVMMLNEKTPHKTLDSAPFARVINTQNATDIHRRLKQWGKGSHCKRKLVKKTSRKTQKKTSEWNTRNKQPPITSFFPKLNKHLERRLHDKHHREDQIHVDFHTPRRLAPIFQERTNLRNSTPAHKLRRRAGKENQGTQLRSCVSCKRTLKMSSGGSERAGNSKRRRREM
ncbi:Hypothetical predicted protein [Pelobates cultripes]|uniref:Pyrin domain-containing protein n=1 Tax=Pelobates cultripes TaxID=61616 RepID=A0AAD1WIW9_PELCU|nr:Hypothetical predicted protein [Pelobates cultripes]